MNNNLSIEEQLLVNSEVEKNGKNIVLAYVLAIFVGILGIHRFYLGRKGSAIAMLILGLFSLGLITGVWVIVDLFLIPGIVKENNAVIEAELTSEIIASREQK